VWAVLTDYNGAASIFSNLSKSKLVSSSGPVKLVAFTTKANVLKFDYTLEVTEKDQELIEWKRSSGAFQANDGYWKLEPLDNGRATLVSYAKHVDGGFFYPQPLVKKLVRESIPAIFSDLKAAAESPQVAEQVRALKFPL
jgi:ribosome-associated toxin RatA of RatAB toxin-antitoxin module